MVAKGDSGTTTKGVKWYISQVIESKKKKLKLIIGDKSDIYRTSVTVQPMDDIETMVDERMKAFAAKARRDGDTAGGNTASGLAADGEAAADEAAPDETAAVGVTSSDAHVGRPPPAELGAMLDTLPSTGSAAR